jgi:hypothetical protein
MDSPALFLVSVAQVNAACRLDLATDGASPLSFADDRLADVELKIAQAQDAVLDYLKAGSDEWTAETVPVRVTAAIILAFQGLYDDKPDLLAGLYDNERTNPIVGLLQRMRNPAVA